MESSITNFIEGIKSIKKTYGQRFFEKTGLHAVLNDLDPRIDKKFLFILKKADDYSLYAKITHGDFEHESMKSIEISKYRHDFTENIGLDSTIASLVFDAYLFGFGLKENLDANEYSKEEANPTLNLKDLIDMATSDRRLEKSEMHNIFKKAARLGLSEKEVFRELTKIINQFNLKPLNAEADIKITNKLTLLKYDWVDESIIRDEKIRLKISQNNAYKEQERIAALKREKSIADLKVKELELKRIEIEFKKKEQEAKSIAEKLSLAERSEKERKLKQKENFKNVFKWLIKKDNEGRTPLYWVFVTLILLCFIGWSLIYFDSHDSSQSDPQVISIQLEKKYDIINMFILNGMLDSAKKILPELVHPSIEKSPYKSDGLFGRNYNYNEYWQIKRDELFKKIENSNFGKGHQVTKGNSKRVKKSSAQENAIQEARLLRNENENSQKVMTPWGEMGITKEDYEQLLIDGYLN